MLMMQKVLLLLSSLLPPTRIRCHHNLRTRLLQDASFDAIINSRLQIVVDHPSDAKGGVQPVHVWRCA
jgi:hypothetical protein